MSNLVSVFDSMCSDFFPRTYRNPWIVQRYCDADGCCSAGFPQLRTSEDEYAFEVDVPGIERDDLVMELDKDILKIYTKSDNEENAQNDEKSQESKRTCCFQCKVPDDIDTTQVKATLRNGVLAITLPKSEEKKPIKVPVMIE